MVKPEWRRLRPSLKQKSIIHVDYEVITDAQLMAVSGNLHIDIGCSDHFLVWVELGRTARNSKKVFRRWRLDRFGSDEVRLRLSEWVKG